MGGEFSGGIPWAALVCVGLAVGFLAVAAWVQRKRPLRICSPFWAYAAGLVVLWCLGPALLFTCLEFFRIPLMPERPVHWMITAVGAVAAFLAGGFAAARLGAEPRPAPPPAPLQAEVYLWILTLFFAGLQTLDPGTGRGPLNYLLKGLTPVMLLLGPVLSIHQVATHPPGRGWIPVFFRAGLVLLLSLFLMMGGSRQISAFLLIYLILGLWCGGVSALKILPAAVLLAVFTICALAFVGVLRVKLNEMEFGRARTLPKAPVLWEALKKSSFSEPLTLLLFSVQTEKPFLPLIGRMAQAESIWIMEASWKTGHRSGWTGFELLPGALLPRVIRTEKEKIFDHHTRYSLYGLRPRESQKLSALPLRTLADTYERFRIPGVLIFHFLLGAWLAAVPLLLARFTKIPGWILGLLSGAWAALALGALEMTLLENLVRFSYGLTRDAAIVLVAVAPAWLLGSKTRGQTGVAPRALSK